MTPPLPLPQILRVGATSPHASVAADTLGISRRTLSDRLEKASLTELRDACATLQAEAEGQLAALRTDVAQSLLAPEAPVTDLTRQMETLRRANAVIARQRAALAREHVVLRQELLQCLKAPRQQQMSTPHRTDAPYTLLHLTRDAPPEVVMAAYRALSKRDHPDVGGSGAAMQRLHWARDMIAQRNGHMP